MPFLATCPQCGSTLTRVEKFVDSGLFFARHTATGDPIGSGDTKSAAYIAGAQNALEQARHAPDPTDWIDEAARLLDCIQ